MRNAQIHDSPQARPACGRRSRRHDRRGGFAPNLPSFLPFERTRRLCRRPQQVARTVPFLPSISCSISRFSHPYAGERCCGRIASPPPLSRQRKNATRASEPIEGKPCIKEMSIRRLGDNPPDAYPLPPPGGGLGRGARANRPSPASALLHRPHKRLRNLRITPEKPAPTRAPVPNIPKLPRRRMQLPPPRCHPLPKHDQRPLPMIAGKRTIIDHRAPVCKAPPPGRRPRRQRCSYQPVC